MQLEHRSAYSSNTTISRPVAVLLAACCVWACAAPDGEDPELDGKGAALAVRVFPVAPPVKVDLPRTKPKPKPTNKTVCGDTAVWLGPTKIGGCPRVQSEGKGLWEATPVFGDDAPEELRRYCAYRWLPSDKGSDARQNLEQLAAYLADRAPDAPPPELDCSVMMPLSGGGTMDPVFWKSLAAQTMHQTSGLRAPAAARGRVRVAVLDTAAVPYHDAALDNYGHGRLVGRLIHDLSCGEGEAAPCATEIVNELALPSVSPGVKDQTHGGYFGSRMDLARAIHKALLTWGEERTSDKSEYANLVLNLSVGWDPSHGGDSKESGQLSPASRLVHSALQRAACLGAISVVAAGNAEGPSQHGAMLPAAWERFAAPDAATCERLIGYDSDKALLVARPADRLTDYRPLVHAVGAVDTGDRALITSRKSSTPHLVGYGLKVVASDVRSEHTDVLSGTSMSAAVLSAAVAAVWGVWPELSAADAAALVYKSAVPVYDTYGVPLSAELCFEGACDSVRRIAVCEAARIATCETLGCAQAPDCSTPKEGSDEALVDMSSFNDVDYPDSAPEACGSANCAARAASSYGASPWVGPQPPRQGCDTCSLYRENERVFVELSPSTGALALDLFIELDSGAAVRVPRPSTGYPSRLSIALPGSASAQSASLVLDVADANGRRTSREPLLVY